MGTKTGNAFFVPIVFFVAKNMPNLFEDYAAAIAAIPNRTPLQKADLLTDTFLLQQQGDLALYWAPFEYVNPAAQVALVGIAPGWHQTELAFRTARDALCAGKAPNEASAQARRAASFSGPIRRNLVEMLDGIGINTALGLESCWALWAERHDLLHTTALVRYPLFIGGQNWTGYKPDALKTPLLRSYIADVLAAELAEAANAPVIPLGRAAAQGLQFLTETGRLEAARLLTKLPHPSGANVHRRTQYAAVQAEAAAAVQAWFRPTIDDRR